MGLKNDFVTSDYVLRLNRAKELLKSFPDSQVLILGGKTVNASISEAKAGRDYLVTQGVPFAEMLVEDHSHHTLENLQQAREFLSDRGYIQVALITNRYHLDRSQALANGIRFAHTPAAEEQFTFSFGMALKLVKEAYLLHWYFVGKWLSKLIRSKKMLDRIN